MIGRGLAARFLFEDVVFADGDDVIGFEGAEDEGGGRVVFEEVGGDASFVEVGIAILATMAARIVTADIDHLDAVAAALLMRVCRQVIGRFAASVCGNDRAVTGVAFLAGGPFGEVFAGEFASEVMRHTFARDETVFG